MKENFYCIYIFTQLYLKTFPLCTMKQKFSIYALLSIKRQNNWSKVLLCLRIHESVFISDVGLFITIDLLTSNAKVSEYVCCSVHRLICYRQLWSNHSVCHWFSHKSSIGCSQWSTYRKNYVRCIFWHNISGTNFLQEIEKTENWTKLSINNELFYEYVIAMAKYLFWKKFR